MKKIKRKTINTESSEDVTHTNILKKEKGITLIALVVTIVVLLILAGVSINLVIGNNGIITKSKEGRDKTEQAVENDMLGLNSLYDEMDSYINGSGEAGDMTLVEAFNEGILQVGDYVNYQNPTSGQYESKRTETGYTSSQTYTTSNNGTTVNWRVLGLSEDGNHLLLTSGSPLKREQGETADEDYRPYYCLFGATAMVNFKDELDNICGIYKNNYADSVKSLTIDDINRLCGVTVHIGTSADGSDSKVYKTSDETQTNIDKRGNIGITKSYTDQYASPQDYLNGTTSSFDKTSNAYSYEGSDAISTSSALYDVLFANTNSKRYWLASSAVGVYSDFCYFGIGLVEDGEADADGHCNQFFSNYVGYENSEGVRPVVTLKSDVKYGQITKITPPVEEKWEVPNDGPQ